MFPKVYRIKVKGGKIMKKRFLLVSLLIALFTVVSFAEEEVTINVSGGSVGIELEIEKEAARAFEELYPGVKVEVFKGPMSAQDRLGLYLQLFETKSTNFDVYQVDVIWPGDLHEHFVDLYKYGGLDYAPNHFQSIIENNTVDGRLVAIPMFTDAGLLYYRKDLLEKYGFDGPPETWEELEKMAKVVTNEERKNNPDFWGYVFQGAAYEGLTCNALEWIASNDGGRIVNRDNEVTIANENAADIIDRVRGWIGTISPEGVLTFDEEAARRIWQTGNALFMRNWPYAYKLGQEEGSAIKGKIGVTKLPHGKGDSAATLGGWQLAVSKYSEHPALAAQVAFFITNYKYQKERAIRGSYNPTIKALYKDPEVLEAVPFFSSLYEVFTNSIARPSTASAPNYNEVSTLFFKTIHRLLSNKGIDTMSALEELALDIAEVTGFKPIFE
jgi:trehalose/maltose transport system substrate-binding protein